MTTNLTFEEKYKAIGSKDSSFEGLFITAVKSTGIFCRPSCRARKPKPENVVFYDSTDEAIKNGFRPCKICKPMQFEDDTPDYIENVLRELQQNPYLKLKDYDLRKRGIEPNQIRRWFKQHHNMTFHAYQRMLRINNAFNKIREGQSITGSAFGVGFESLSGFQEGWQQIFGSAPTNSTKQIINITRFATDLGPMFACATANGVCLLEFTNRRMLETEFTDLQKRLNAVILPGENEHLAQVEKEIGEYFDGQRKEFGVSIEAPGTDFQKTVWNHLLQIPYGETVSYGDLARRLRRPSAVRAVANANGHNRIAIIIPCHRVIGSDGNLTGYGGGLDRKRQLLSLEQTHR